MNVYVETNFVLELAFVQEQHESCERIVALCEAQRASLVLPAFCIAESYETLIRRGNARKAKWEEFARELGQLKRSEPYKDEIDAYQSITGLISRSKDEEKQRLNAVLERLSKIAQLIPIDAAVFLDAVSHGTTYKLEPQDAIVFSSVLRHLALANDVESCFVSKDRKAFDDPDIVEMLAKQECKTLFSFIDGCNYIEHRVDTD